MVPRGACDKLFLTTTGIGVIRAAASISAPICARPGDVVLVNGVLGDHGAAILAARGDLALDAPIESDCAPLHGLDRRAAAAAPGTRFLRDATRGGVATVLNEIAEARRRRDRASTKRRLPMREEVKGFCEILGLDPLYLANEGKLVAVVPRGSGRRRARGDARASARRATPCAIGRVTRRGRAGSSCARCSAARASSTCWSATSCRGSADACTSSAITRNIVAIVGEAAARPQGPPRDARYRHVFREL